MKITKKQLSFLIKKELNENIKSKLFSDKTQVDNVASSVVDIIAEHHKAHKRFYSIFQFDFFNQKKRMKIIDSENFLKKIETALEKAGKLVNKRKLFSKIFEQYNARVESGDIKPVEFTLHVRGIDTRNVNDFDWNIKGKGLKSFLQNVLMSDAARIMFENNNKKITKYFGKKYTTTSGPHDTYTLKKEYEDKFYANLIKISKRKYNLTYKLMKSAEQ